MPDLAACGDVGEEQLSFKDTTQAATGLVSPATAMGRGFGESLGNSLTTTLPNVEESQTFSVDKTNQTSSSDPAEFLAWNQNSQYESDADADTLGSVNGQFLECDGLVKPPFLFAQTSLGKKAIEDPNQLTKPELSEVARAICERAVEQEGTAETTALLCGDIIAKARSSDFADSLLDWCLVWFVRRDDLLPRRLLEAEEPVSGNAPPFRYSWTAFIGFIAELVKVFENGGGSGAGQAWKSTTHPFLLASIFCSCVEVMLCSPAEDSLREVMCFGASLMSAGKVLELVAPDQMDALHESLLSASSNPSFPVETRRCLPLITRLRSLGWEYPAM